MEEQKTKHEAEAPLPSGVFGYCATNHSGEEVERKGQTSGNLEDYVAYFNQLTALVGDSLGLDEAESLIIYGKKEHVFCCEVDGLHFAANLKPKTNLGDVTAFFKGKEEEDEFFA